MKMQMRVSDLRKKIADLDDDAFLVVDLDVGNDIAPVASVVPLTKQEAGELGLRTSNNYVLVSAG
jgi:hypothetical protein